MKKILLFLMLSMLPFFVIGQQYIYDINITFYGTYQANAYASILYDENSENIFFDAIYHSSPYNISRRTMSKPIKIRFGPNALNEFSYGPDICEVSYAENDGSVIFNNDNYTNKINYGACNVSISVNVKRYLKTGILFSGSTSNIFCGNQTLKLTVPEYIGSQFILNDYEWYVSQNGIFSSTPVATTQARELNLTMASIKSIYPNYNGEVLYFKVKQQGFPYTETSQALTFYPSLPTPQTKTPIAPPCFGGKGSITLSNFKYDDGTTYNGGESLSLGITNQASGIPEAPITFNSSSITVPNLAPGDYTVQIGNAAATCTSSFSFTIPPAPPPITASATVQNPDCSTGYGTITVTANGGTPPYTYAIDGNYQTSNVFELLPTGSYVVTVTDANNCTPATTATVNVTIPPAINLVLNNKVNPSAFGSSNGQFVVAASGGTETTYTYAVNGGAYTTADTFSALSAGTYSIIAKDSKGCLSTPLNVVLTEPLPLALSVVSQTDNTCFGGNSGQIEVSASGGIAPYTYALNGSSYQTSNLFNNLSAGSYNLSVKDANGNIATINANILAPNKIAADVLKTDATCFGANGTITINNATGGLGNTYTYSSDGNSFQTSNVFSLPQGTYNIKIKDSNGCMSDDYSITINQPPASLNATATSQDAQCYGAANGSITITATGGSGNYSYSIDNGTTTQATGLFTGLAAGQYQVKVKDQAGCTFSLSVQVKQPQELILYIDSKVDATCFGGTGTISVSATGGEGNVTYSSNPSLPFSNGLFTGATAGTYIIQITDDNGCSKTTSVTINQPSQVTINATTAAVSCYGGTDGKVTLLPTGGTSPYTYSVKNLNTYTTSNIFNGLAAGDHIFSVKDQNGCVTDIAVTVTQPAPLALTVVQKQNVRCHGANNGSITVNTSGGTGIYTYQINGVSTGANGTFSNLASGNYTISVTDENGCYKEIFETINEPSALNLSLVNQINIKCSGTNTGEITVTASGGTAPYQYAINNSAYQSNPTFNNLNAASYTIHIKDANQCIKSIVTTLTEPPKLTAFISKQDVKCFGDASGIITVNATGGEAPFSYSLNGSSFQINNVFSNLVAGNYTILVQDKNNCQFTEQVIIINVAPQLALTIAATSPTTCDGVGSIAVSNVIGGVGPYVYSIDGINFSATTSFNSLPAGTYTVFVKDSNGCTNSQTKTISVPSGISAKSSTTDVACFSANNGKIVVKDVVGGNGNYLYAINGGSFQSANTFNNLAAGNYTVVVKDNPYSCQYTINVTISQPSLLSLELKSSTNVSCYGQNNGKIEVSANGGTAPYQYSIDGGTTFTSSGNFSSLIAKAYTIIVKDASECTSQITVSLIEPSLLSLSFANKTDVSCFGAKNGSITVQANGGTQPYQYGINGSSLQSTNRFDNLSEGSYVINVIDANGCSTNTTVVINQNPVLALTVNAFKNLSCNGNASGEITANATGGSGNYQYSINNGSFQASPIFSRLSAGSYQITVKDDKGCTMSITKTITEPSILTVSKQVTQQKCFDACTGEIKLSVTGGTAPYTYQWAGGVYGNVASISNLCGGLYKVTIVDANGCTVEDATSINTPPEIKITGVSDTVLCVDQVVTYDAGNPGFTYLWTADNGFLKNTQKVQLSQAGKYQLKVTNTDGCSVTKNFTIQTSTTLLKANFLVSTYANVGDTVIVVDVSKPTPAKTSWLFDTGATNAGGNASGTVKQLTFSTPGVYNLMMMVKLGQCSDAVQKSITILPKEQKAAVNDALGYKEELIKEFKAYPNPNNGEFKALVKLSNKSDIKLSIYDFNGAIVLPAQGYTDKDTYEVDFSQKNIRTGLYILALEAGNEIKTLKIIKL